MSNLQVALDFLKKYPQARLFPAMWENGTHAPMVAWSRYNSGDPAQIESWAASLGERIYFCIALRQSGMSVIDTDNKKNKDGDMNLLNLLLEYGELPDTLMAGTPSNGHHRLFLGDLAFGANRLGVGIDSPVMIPIPGSNAHGKGIYRIVADKPLAQLPAWVAELAGRPSEKAPNRDDAVVEPDLDHNVLRVIDYLTNRAPESIEGAGGDSTAYTVACHVRDLGVSKETATDLMMEHYAPKCHPFDAPWLVKKIENAYAYAQAPLGSAAPPVHMLDSLPSDTDVFDDIEVIPAGGLMDSEPEKVDWLIDGWLTKGDPCLFTGDGGIGKSLITMQIFAHLACGRPIFGLEIPDPVQCLMILCEDDKKEIHRRFRRIIDHPSFALDNKDKRLIRKNLRFVSMVGKNAIISQAEKSSLTYGPFMPKLQNLLRDMGSGHKAVALDTVADVYGGDENNRSHVNQFVKHHVCKLLEDNDATGVLIGHPPKNTGAEYSGSTAWNGAFRSRMFIKALDKAGMRETHRVLSLPKSNRSLSGSEMVLGWNNGVYVKTDEVEIITPLREQNLDIVMEKIIEAWDEGAPWSLSHQSARYIKNIKGVKGGDGREMTGNDLKELVIELINERHVQNNVGKKHGNGLEPLRMRGSER